ncbi:MAG TPA: PilZ domain-containing protein [Candidatus Acidoferrales bacterium]|nr:PilZ domain-containing protein [Candidatus Acidoferrales bacterium]
MATARAMLERRRSTRVKTRIPVKVFSPHSVNPIHAAEVLAVSRTGALLRAPFAPEVGSRIEIRHGLSEERREFRVIQVIAAKAEHFDLGVEMLYPGRNFWGVDFADDETTSLIAESASNGPRPIRRLE